MRSKDQGWSVCWENVQDSREHRTWGTAGGPGETVCYCSMAIAFLLLLPSQPAPACWGTYSAHRPGELKAPLYGLGRDPEPQELPSSASTGHLPPGEHLETPTPGQSREVGPILGNAQHSPSRMHVYLLELPPITPCSAWLLATRLLFNRRGDVPLVKLQAMCFWPGPKAADLSTWPQGAVAVRTALIRADILRLRPSPGAFL